MRSKLLSLAILLVLAAPAAAEAWKRLEYVGGYIGPNVLGADVISYGVYHDRYGIGVGTKLLDFRLDNWDLPRHGKHDASSHATFVPVPLELRVVLASWEGDPFVEYVSAESSNARIEAHAWYCPWTYYGFMTDVEPGVFGPERNQIADIARGNAWDAGIGYDAGQFWSFTVGRNRLRVRDDGNFRAREKESWYAALRLYYGHTHGRTVGANPGNIFRDVGFKLCRLVGRCGIIEN